MTRKHLLIFLLIPLTAGCQPPQPPQSVAPSSPPTPSAQILAAGNTPEAQAYANAYKTIMEDFRDKMKALSSRPMPPRISSPKQNRANAADQMQDIVEATDGFIQRMDQLTPPPVFQETHATTRAFLKASSDGTKTWIAALRKGDRKAFDKADKDLNESVAKAADDMSKATEKLGLNVPSLRQLSDELKQEAKQEPK